MDELPGVELRHLRYFLAVAEAGTVTGAAARLHIAQPSLSQQIAALERRVGAPLFHRGRQGMTPTEAGQTLLLAVRRAFGEIDDAVSRIRGAVPEAATGLCRGVPLPVLDAAAAAVGEGVRLVFSPVDSARQATLLRSGELAFGVQRDPVDTTGLLLRTLHDAPLGVVVPRGHPLVRRAREDGELTWGALAGHRLLWFPASRAPAYAAAVLAQLSAHGWEPETVVDVGGGHSLFRHALLSDDHLVALRPQAALADDNALAWLPVGPNPPRERLVLAAAEGTAWARLLEGPEHGRPLDGTVAGGAE
ncbi:LysR family transcriptional regulator [Streptacidiphilus anmyonensis]|uniref:LysR family transcriptional regulator n=1 Tax=Streptacidiphilus anmyonensis TaxID=405782 RepID=UPI0005AA8BE7|nr:LysR family transcriptional regulator [Streptacidiphilus anmyonensis]